jgi:hypothetical protein
MAKCRYCAAIELLINENEADSFQAINVTFAESRFRGQRAFWEIQNGVLFLG